MSKSVFTVIAMRALFYCAGLEFGRTPRIVTVAETPDPNKYQVTPDGLKLLQASPFLTVIDGDTLKVAEDNEQLKQVVEQAQLQIKALREENAALKAAAQAPSGDAPKKPK